MHEQLHWAKNSTWTIVHAHTKVSQLKSWCARQWVCMVFPGNLVHSAGTCVHVQRLHDRRMWHMSIERHVCFYQGISVHVLCACVLQFPVHNLFITDTCLSYVSHSCIITSNLIHALFFICTRNTFVLIIVVIVSTMLLGLLPYTQIVPLFLY